jgi:hypothetical protein
LRAAAERHRVSRRSYTSDGQAHNGAVVLAG